MTIIKNFLSLLFIAGLLGWQTSSFAAINLELTQGIDAALPIAILPFVGEHATDKNGQQIAEVIQADLQNSGRFKLLDTHNAAAPTNNLDIDAAYWRKQRADHVVVGRVKALSGNQYEVEFKLLDMFTDKAAHPSLLTKSYTVDASQLRRLAHHISDVIYEQLMGEKGIFSTHIAYVLVQRAGGTSQYTLEIADIDGVNAHPLLRSKQPIMSPAWAPNGRQVAYVSFEGNRASIYIEDINTGSRYAVASYAGVNGAPAWSPDGRKLALVLSKDGNPKIYTLDLASKTLTQLTRGLSLDTEPCWAPDGRSLLFTSNRGGNNPQIYRLNLSSGSIERVTFSGDYNATASFDTRGLRIAMLRGQGGQYNIAIQDLKSGRTRILTDSGMDESPSIASNGSMVVYATKHGGRGVLGMVSADGRVKLRLPAREGDVQGPAWSPH